MAIYTLIYIHGSGVGIRIPTHTSMWDSRDLQNRQMVSHRFLFPELLPRFIYMIVHAYSERDARENSNL